MGDHLKKFDFFATCQVRFSKFQQDIPDLQDLCQSLSVSHSVTQAWRGQTTFSCPFVSCFHMPWLAMMWVFCLGTLNNVGKSQRRLFKRWISAGQWQAWPKKKCVRAFADDAGLSILHREDNSHKGDLDEAYSVCGQTCSACLAFVKLVEKQIDPFLKWKYSGCPADRNRWNLIDRSNRGGTGSLWPDPRFCHSDLHGLQTRRWKCSVLVRPQWPTAGAKPATSRRRLGRHCSTSPWLLSLGNACHTKVLFKLMSTRKTVDPSPARLPSKVMCGSTRWRGLKITG